MSALHLTNKKNFLSKLPKGIKKTPSKIDGDPVVTIKKHKFRFFSNGDWGFKRNYEKDWNYGKYPSGLNHIITMIEKEKI